MQKKAILPAEDNPGGVGLTKRPFDKHRIHNHLVPVIVKETPPLK